VLTKQAYIYKDITETGTVFTFKQQHKRRRRRRRQRQRQQRRQQQQQQQQQQLLLEQQQQQNGPDTARVEYINVSFSSKYHYKIYFDFHFQRLCNIGETSVSSSKIIFL
jgi:hypothetical protein